MARTTLNLKISLENIHCFDEGDGWGNAEPYLWPVFFKIDGESYAVESGTGLIGFPIIESRNGHHGNLGDTDVDAGDNVPVPETLGTWQNTLKAIPINDPVIKGLIGDDLPGIAGVAVVLMEQDSWPDDLADTGYNALVNAIQLSVLQIAQGFQHATHAPTKEEIDAAIKTVKDTASSMVHAAIKDAMSGWQLIWYGTFGNNDDTIGSEVWTTDQDELKSKAVVSFYRRWSGDESGDGDWDISGSFTGVVPCPADFFSSLFGGEDNNKETMAAMREFRVKDYIEHPGLERWWQVIRAGLPDVVRIVKNDSEALEIVKRLFDALPSIIANPDNIISEEHIANIRIIMDKFSKDSPYLYRTFARRALKIIPEIQGRSWSSAIRQVSYIRPRGRKR